MRRAWRVALAVGLSSLAFVYAQARRSRAAEPPTLGEGMRYRSSSWTAEDWRREGYMEMVSPIRPPTSDDGRVRIAVYVRVPADGIVRGVTDQQGFSLEVPPGTDADRLELLADSPGDGAPEASWRILDVRGIAFDTGGQRLRVLRPRDASGRELFGLEWRRGADQGLATTVLGELVLRGNVATPAQAGERTRAAQHLRGLNDCPSCHTPRSGGRRTRRDPGIVNRAADGSGLFQLASIFSDRLPIETYRPRDANLTDPFIARFCGVTRVAASTVHCLDGSIVEGELDVRAGVAHGDVHALRVCESRRALARHFDATARDRLRDALVECEGTSAP